jgi:uncharacterized protein
MRLFFDINHPVHYHTYKKLIARFLENGHSCFTALRKKDVLIDLVHSDSLISNFIIKGRGSNTKFGRVFTYIKWNLMNLFWAVKYKPKLLIGFGSPYLSFAGFFLCIPVIIIDDTEIDHLLQKTYLPFSRKVITPLCFTKNFGNKQKKLPFLKELTYLSVSINKLVSKQDTEQPVILLRFTSGRALHDSNRRILTDMEKIHLVEMLNQFGKTYISFEGILPYDLHKFRLIIKPHKMHSFIKESMDIFVGDSATMAAEAAVLGKLSIYIDNQTRGYIDYLENEYKLVKHFKQLNINEIKNYISSEFKYKFLKVRFNMALKLKNDHIDLTEFLWKYLSFFNNSR